VREVGPELGLMAPEECRDRTAEGSRGGREVEVTP